MKNKIIRVMQLNDGVTKFGDVFLGGAVMIMCGAVGLAFYATLQKVFQMLGRMYVGYLQKRYADRDLLWISKTSVRCEALNGAIRAFGMMLIPFSTIGILIVGVGNVLYGLDKAFNNLYQERVVDLITEDVSGRLKFKGDLNHFVSICDFAGMAVNFAIFGTGHILHINEITLLNIVCFTYGVLKLIDITTSFIERKLVLSIIKNGQ